MVNPNMSDFKSIVEDVEIKQGFTASYDYLAEIVTRISENKGWVIDNKAEKIALMHSELSEVLEAFRHGNPPDSHIPEFTGAEAELADVIIRIMHFGYSLGLDVPNE